jgi:hypothetical protein
MKYMNNEQWTEELDRVTITTGKLKAHKGAEHAVLEKVLNTNTTDILQVFSGTAYMFRPSIPESPSRPSA